MGVRPNSPLHQTIVLCQQAPAGQVFQQGRHPLVHFRQFPPHGLKVLLVRVPALVIDRDVRDAVLDQPPRHQARLPESVAPVPVPQVFLLPRQVEQLAFVAQDQLIGLLLGFDERGERIAAAEGVLERIQLAQQFAAVLLLLVGDAGGNHAFDHEAGLGRIAARGERLVAGRQEAGLGEPALRLGQHDVGRNQSAVAGVVTAKQRDHGSHTGKDVAPAGIPAGLNHVGRRLVAVVAVRHAADDGILVGLLGQQGQQLADDDAVDVRADRFVQGAAVVVAGRRLGVERVQVRTDRPTSRSG